MFKLKREYSNFWGGHSYFPFSHHCTAAFNAVCNLVSADCRYLSLVQIATSFEKFLNSTSVRLSVRASLQNKRNSEEITEAGGTLQYKMVC